MRGPIEPHSARLSAFEGVLCSVVSCKKMANLGHQLLEDGPMFPLVDPNTDHYMVTNKRIWQPLSS